jgi:hypothetical protein
MKMKTQTSLIESECKRSRLVRIIQDPDEIRRFAKSVGKFDLVEDAFTELHRWIDEAPEENHVVTTRGFYDGSETAGLKALCVIMLAHTNGLITEAAALFEFEYGALTWEECHDAMIKLVEQSVAPILMRHLAGASGCSCCGGRTAE